MKRASALRALGVGALLLSGATAAAQAGGASQPYPYSYPDPPPPDPQPPEPQQRPPEPPQPRAPAQPPAPTQPPAETPTARTAPPPATDAPAAPQGGAAVPSAPVPAPQTVDAPAPQSAPSPAPQAAAPPAAAPPPQPTAPTAAAAATTAQAAPIPTAAPPSAGGTASAAALPPPASPPPSAALGGAVPGAVPGTTGPTDRRVHALERTLVERGGLLLEPGRFELVPQIGYAVSDHDPVLAPDGSILDAQTRRFLGSITLRLGLPLRFQAEGEVPYSYVQETPRPPTGTAAGSESGGGIGDVRAALTWHVLRSGGAFPDLLVNGFYKARTGGSALDPTPTRVPLGSGIEQFGGGLSIVKALDPVVLLAAVSASESVPRKIGTHWLDPRAELAVTTTVILAVSPETSLSFGLEQAYSQNVQVDRRDVAGTNRTAAVFDVGFATLASRAGLLQITLGIGLTEDVPRFQLGLATPLQF